MFQIEEGLYQGARPKDYNAMKDWAIVCLEHHDDCNNLDKEVGAFVHLPIYDGPFPGLSWLRMAVKTVEALREVHDNVYIHCRGGVSRSIMLTAAYLMKKNYWTVDEAMNFIAENNPNLNPNRRFMEGLREWQQQLGR